ncbi:hypothetical protein [Sutcliffiella sp. FSL R7-0096]|uniref:hypothetical protein n=1 Tax=Sutcliffiella sp. FSL R7-0096 TaxID=2921670 RepID=UPI003159B941
MFNKLMMQVVLLWTFLFGQKVDQSPKRTEGKLLPLQLQFFADGGEGDPPPADPQGGNEPPNNDPPPADPPKTFTQDELNNIAAKEAKKAQEKIFKELGLDFENAKEGMKAFKDWSESQKTEQQKQADRLKDLEKNYSSASEENTSLKAQLSALKANVKAESVEDVVTLAKTMVSEELDMDGAIAKIVEKYPHFAQKVEEQQEEKKPSFSTGQHQKKPESDTEKWLNAFK